MTLAYEQQETAIRSKRLVSDLRTDHAGETGAVYIYRGILAVSRDPAVIAFSEAHLKTEQSHLEKIEAVLAKSDRSRLIPLWRVAGWLTGALPALFGRNAVYHTINAVETFVDHHYQEQIDRLEASGDQPEILALLKACQADEQHHRDEAAGLGTRQRGPLLSMWTQLVDAGSKAAVGAARVI